MSAIDLAAGLVRQFEGCQLQAYHDVGRGVMTIGWGHTGRVVHEGLIWTQAQADAALVNDLQNAAIAAHSILKIKATDRQLGALISLCFNVPVSDLKTSLLISAFNDGRWSDAVHQWIRWDHSNHEEEKGLLRRRLIEAALYLEGT